MLPRTKWQRPAEPARFRVEVTFRKPGQETPLCTPAKRDVVLEGTKSSGEAKAWLSIGTLAVTILIVSLGLASGAEEKLRSLELLPGAIAVFVLGFGADTLKTLITRISD